MSVSKIKESVLKEKIYMKLLILLISLLSCSAEDIQMNDINITFSYIYSEKELIILNDINLYRNSLGLSSLELQDFVSVKCLEHTQYMILENRLTHDGFENRAEEIKRQTNTTKIGECVSYNFDNPVNAWINSSGHRLVLETSVYTKIGISFRDGYCTIILIK